MYLVDTDVISELRKGISANAAVIAWASSVHPDELFISSVTVLEIETGALRLQRKDPMRAAVLLRWLEERVIASFGDRVLPVDTPVARECAKLHVPAPRPYRDSLIAATALVHGFTVVTRNVKDFTPMLSALVNPWDHVMSVPEGTE